MGSLRVLCWPIPISSAKPAAPCEAAQTRPTRPARPLRGPIPANQDMTRGKTLGRARPGPGDLVVELGRRRMVEGEVGNVQRPDVIMELVGNRIVLGVTLGIHV